MFALGTARTQSSVQRQYVGTYKVTQTDLYIYEVKGAPDNHVGLLEALFNDQDGKLNIWQSMCHKTNNSNR